MNRRRFLSLLGQAAAGATVAYSFPSIIVPKNIQPVTLNGLAGYINSGSTFSGYETLSFPDLNSPVVNLSGAMLTPEMFDSARRAIRASMWREPENPLLYPVWQARLEGACL